MWFVKSLILVLGLVAVSVVGGLAQGSAELTSSSIRSRFFQRSDESLTEFRAFRHLEARNLRFNAQAWMDVRTELSTAGVFTFGVISEGGSPYIRRKVLRPILEGERDLIASGDAARSALTAENYELTREDPAPPGLVRLTMKPLRRDRMLVDGAVFVTDNDADLVRIEGRLARNPSFWTTRVDIVRRYGRIAGVRVPLSVDSTAHVRIAGTSTMSMTYRYEMVNGLAVSTDTHGSNAEER